jgi:hypothetical protein
VNAGKQADCSVAGPPAIEALDSFVVISDENLRGADGGDACDLYHYCTDGARGGDAILARNSQILLLGYDGRYEHSVRGGDGGDAMDPYNDCHAGDGGDGFFGSLAFVSMVRLLGGEGGSGQYPGGPGLPWEGTLTESDVVPYFKMTGDFHPGGAFQLDLDIVYSGGLLFLFADHQGFITVPGNPGPPLGAIPFPGGRFVTFYGGHLGALGHTTVSLVLPNDPGLRGTPVNAQCAVLLDGGGVVLSNSTTHVVAE